MKRKVAAVVFIGSCLVMNFFPHFGPPHFRYTGSDPSTHVWNVGWPLATAIYDQHSGLHVAPHAYVLWPFEAIAVVVTILAARWRRSNGGRP